MIPKAEVVHQIDGRTRLRIPSHRHDKLFFAKATEAFRSVPGVRAVKANPITGSLVIEHDRSWKSLVVDLLRFGLMTIEGRPAAEPWAPRFPQWVAQLNERMRKFSHGELDFNSMIGITLCGLGVVQFSRGQLLPAATSLFEQGVSVWASRTALSSPRSRSVVADGGNHGNADDSEAGAVAGLA